LYTVENTRNLSQKKRASFLHVCTKKQCRSFIDCPTKWKQQHPEVIEQEKAEKKKKRKEIERENVKETKNKKVKYKEKKKSNAEEMSKKFAELKNLDGLEKVNSDPHKFVGSMHKVKNVLSIDIEDDDAIKSNTTTQSTKPLVFANASEEENYYKAKYEEAQAKRIKERDTKEHFDEVLAFFADKNVDVQTFINLVLDKQNQSTSVK